MITNENRHWHLDCFKCVECNSSLIGKGFISDGERDIYCSDCTTRKLSILMKETDDDKNDQV